MGHTTIYRVGLSPTPKDNFNGKRKKIHNYNTPQHIEHTNEIDINNKHLEWLHKSLKRYSNILKEKNCITLNNKSILEFPKERATEITNYIKNLKTQKDFINYYCCIPIRSQYTENEEPLIIFNENDSQSIIYFDQFLIYLAQKLLSENNNKTETKLYIYNIYDANI